MKKIAFIGGLGQIGQVLYKALKDDYTIVLIDVRPDNALPVIHADISDFQSLLKAVPPDTDILFDLTTALCKLNLVGAEAFEKMNQVYVKGMYNLFEVAKMLGIKRVIFSSSTHVSGLYEKNGFSMLSRKIKESDYPKPDGTYGSMKLFGESIARLYASEHDIKVTCMRFGGVFEANDCNKYYMRSRRIILYHEDLVMIMKAVFETVADFGIFYAVSENENKPWRTRKLRKVFKIKQSDFIVKQNSSLYHKAYMKLWRAFHFK